LAAVVAHRCCPLVLPSVLCRVLPSICFYALLFSASVALVDLPFPSVFLYFPAFSSLLSSSTFSPLLLLYLSPVYA
jgi:hypothetical protein